MSRTGTTAVRTLFLAIVAGSSAMPLVLDAADALPEPPYTELVRRLGDPSFDVRTAASARLISVGMPAKPALMRAIKDDDLEVRLAAHRVLVTVLQRDFDARVTAFLEHGSHAAGEMPGWDLFQRQVGDSELSRHLFADMMRAESGLLTALSREDADVSKQVLSRLQDLSQNRANLVNGLVPPIPRASLAAVLFAVCQIDIPPDSAEAQVLGSQLTARLYSLLSSARNAQLIAQESYSPLIRQLLVRWVDMLGKRIDRSDAYFGMQLALKYELKETGLQIARQVLQQGSGSYSSAKPYAAIIIGRFGGREDAQYLEPHLSDTQVFHTWSNAQLKKEPIRIQVRDVMLAMSLRLNGRQPEQFGFKLLEPYPETIYRIWTFGFLEDEERDAAFGKWRQLTQGAVANAAADAERTDDRATEPDVATGG